MVGAAVSDGDRAGAARPRSSPATTEAAGAWRSRWPSSWPRVIDPPLRSPGRAENRQTSSTPANLCHDHQHLFALLTARFLSPQAMITCTLALISSRLELHRTGPMHQD